MAPVSITDFSPPFAVSRPDTAEDLAAFYLRWAGFLDATRTPTGADAGLDVVSRTTLAQVKFKVGTTGRPDLQRLFGAAAHAPDRQLCFFSLAQYSDGAKSYAIQHGIALFGYDRLGRVWPCNGHAGEIHRAAVATHVAEDRRKREREAARQVQAAEAERLARAESARKQAELDERARRKAAANRARKDARTLRRAARAAALERKRGRLRDARAARPSATVKLRSALLTVGFVAAVCGMAFGGLGVIAMLGELIAPGGQPHGVALGGLVFYGVIAGGASLAARSARRRRAARRPPGRAQA